MQPMTRVDHLTFVVFLAVVTAHAPPPRVSITATPSRTAANGWRVRCVSSRIRSVSFRAGRLGLSGRVGGASARLGFADSAALILGGEGVLSPGQVTRLGGVIWRRWVWWVARWVLPDANREGVHGNGCCGLLETKGASFTITYVR